MTAMERATDVCGHVVIVGGGISGLAAAWQLARRAREAGQPIAITVLEATGRVGGQLAHLDIAGTRIDGGAEALVLRDGDTTRSLVDDLDLGWQLTSPVAVGAAIHAQSALRPLPRAHLLGIPATAQAMTGLVTTGLISQEGMLRAEADLALAATPVTGPAGADVALGPYLRERLGPELVERVVAPLAAGVYGGSLERLSLRASMPTLWGMLRGGESSVLACVRHLHQPADITPALTSSLVTLTGGLAGLPLTLASHLVRRHGVTIKTRQHVRQLRRTSAGWEVVSADVDGAVQVRAADAVIVATPLPAAAAVIAEHAPAAATALAHIEHESAIVVALAYPRTAWPSMPRLSGYLVPPNEARPVKAVTFSSVKWPHVDHQAPHLMLVRCSLAASAQMLQRPDHELVALAAEELERTMGVRRPLADTRVLRWPTGLPQYTLGHRDRIGQALRALADVPGLTVCGAAFDGVGISGCLAAAESAAARTLTDLLHPEGFSRPRATPPQSATSGRPPIVTGVPA